ncbi:Dual specificity protein phosphatase CDC14A, putative [Trichomonas vaginalis G3]|uniref:Dual specificity protein phosphatase CDC14A, putative n=1 Tax=Trichomonas vaginalis (strain ATCC PRA-98 / G3) TaxID=412133 RepID=A2E026_TRIV3|nr:protein tyrosine/serine/threonine phosphatase protein [Trichomonas vaginalis G3]EAY13945.1 Dual specificity protein phosphatase CDC14A, putative [Trichomonas vaginalis G3]KAI5551756.1 protein tyrosine/serine/threonine phosphatase protein [Trichomonas vaginalis G3]|eukprot:XP_001326168.1 Dual specificity protein phosphatase CDC14A [Trichomonas vaginalis G3]
MTLIRSELGITIIPGKLYMHCLQEKPKDNICDHYFNYDEIPALVFEAMSRENGPPSLHQITEFIKVIKDKLTKINKQIHICVSLAAESRVNCMFLICAMILLERDFINSFLGQQNNQQYVAKWGKPKPRKMPDYDDPISIFKDVYPPIEEFEDATASPFTISLSDALNGFIKGAKLGWYSQTSFDSEVYNFYLQPENGFMTWIVPNRLLVLSAPGVADSPLLFDMLPLFRKWHIYTVVSFTTELRGAEDLTRIGIEHLTLDTPQDSLPSISDVIKFCDLCDQGHPVAICSLNGLGRGPMFGAAWLIRRFGFHPKEAIGWIRCVRQGSIYGVQQDFLMRIDRSFNPDSVQTAPAKSGPTLSLKSRKNQTTSITSKPQSRLGTAGKTISTMNSPSKRKPVIVM